MDTDLDYDIYSSRKPGTRYTSYYAGDHTTVHCAWEVNLYLGWNSSQKRLGLLFPPRRASDSFCPCGTSHHTHEFGTSALSLPSRHIPLAAPFTWAGAAPRGIVAPQRPHSERRRMSRDIDSCEATPAINTKRCAVRNQGTLCWPHASSVVCTVNAEPRSYAPGELAAACLEQPSTSAHGLQGGRKARRGG